LELKTGLDGHAVDGQTSEIEIRLLSTSVISGQLEINDAFGHTLIPVKLSERVEKTFWQAVTVEQNKSIIVRWIPEHGDIIEKQLLVDHSQTALTIISRSIPLKLTLDKNPPSVAITPVILSTQNLPHTPQAYAGIEAFITAPQTLSSLSKDQYLALSDYLSSCNILLLSTVEQPLLKRLKDFSGCSGRFIQSYETLEQIPQILATLKGRRSAQTPSADEMTLAGQKQFQQQMLSSIVLYLTGYILFIILLTWFIKKTQYQLLIPLIVAGAGILAWSGEGSQQLISWVEAESGDNHVINSSLLFLGGNRSGDNSISLNTTSRLSSGMKQAQQPQINYQQNLTSRVLTVKSQLLSPQTFKLTSISTQSLPFELKIQQDLPKIITFEDSIADKALLLWRGQTYDIPSLTPGTSWQPDETMGKSAVSPAEKLLLSRLAFDAPAILMPFTPNYSGVISSNLQHTGWLVIRHQPEWL